MDLIDLFQQSWIHDAQNTAQQAKSATTQSQSQISDLQRKADALTLACQAMWEMICAQTGLRDEALLEKMQEIDARDGRTDGKISTAAQLCPRCKRKSNAKRLACLYCGERLPIQHVFDKER
ncbi:MAG TPA: hypothetical protein VF384_03735 [Planctomycetota bacterium]